MRIGGTLLGVLCLFAFLAADDHIVEADNQVDFSAFRTFVLHDGRIESASTDFNNSLVRNRIREAVHDQLVAKGLKEVTVRPDLVADYSLDATAYTIGTGGRAHPIGPDGRGDNSPAPLGTVDPVGFVEGTIVVDLRTDGPGLLVWRGVYRDSAGGSAKLVEKFSGEIKILFSEFPPKKK